MKRVLKVMVKWKQINFAGYLEEDMLANGFTWDKLLKNKNYWQG